MIHDNDEIGQGGMLPQWTLADRLEKSLDVQKISVAAMAEFFGLHRNTISAWINGRTSPPIHAVKLWALRTGVSYAWLRGDPEPAHNGYHLPPAVVPTVVVVVKDDSSENETDQMSNQIAR